ncbi:hypothetical protein M2428_001046 [Arthrobacter sp. ES3-54]|nr:hypothetical protein [Arthrobacter sp. ES3-54]
MSEVITTIVTDVGWFDPSPCCLHALPHATCVSVNRSPTATPSPAKLSRLGWTIATVAPLSAQLTGYARDFTYEQDPATRRKAPTGLGVPEGRTNSDHGVTGRYGRD